MNDLVLMLSYHRWPAAIAAAALLLALFLFGGCGGEGEGSLAGTVTDKQGRAVSWGTITAVGQDNKVYTAPIRQDGSYELTGLPAGMTYKIAVSSPNPRPAATPPPANKDPKKPAPGGGTSGGPAAPKGAGSSGSGASGKGGGDKPKSSEVQTFGIEPKNSTIAPPPVAAPRNAPPADQWFPIPGRYANPQTSGLSAPAARGRTTQNITLE